MREQGEHSEANINLHKKETYLAYLKIDKETQRVIGGSKCQRKLER